ncbi:membrane-flanked domain protein [Methanothermus fervidus DSM 2088]|uniref:Membrane-flanked domain protein n=1 Tax=Methanothermus fervidus (strain ATCC 43054 / DSM 2088 / JCM 10308 / V24 S) TaxID=523846 RepID=E3GYD5_METFV|nr:PH domain-containing protein [Methanothermus fervidus]ADP77317.1 membrane-flanked domain protein [Methanothermus fervidus DSM 2088]
MENIVYKTRPNIILYTNLPVKLIFLLILIYLFPLAMNFLYDIEKTLIPLPLITLLTYIFAFIGIILILSIFLDFLSWKFTNYILTDHRLIVESGFLRKERAYIHYPKIVDITIHQGIIDRMFNVGDMEIRGGHDIAPLILRKIPRPEEFEEKINQLISSYESKK